MAPGSATPGPPAPPPVPGTQKVSDVISTFREQRRFKGPAAITSLDFDDTGELAIVARDDDTLQIYNCKEGKHAKELQSKKYGVHLARFSHHSQSIIYASTKIDDNIRFVSVHDNSFIRYFRGHTDTVTSISLCPANDTFLSASNDGTVKLWDLNSQNYQGSLTITKPRLVVYDPSASVVAIAVPSVHCVMLYDIRNYVKPPFATFDLHAHTQRFLPGQDAEWTKLEFSNDGKCLVVSTAGSGHFVLDAFTGDLIHFAYRQQGDSGRLAPGATFSGTGKAPAKGQGDTCLSPCGQYLLGGCGDTGILVWDLSKDSGSQKVLEPTDKLPGKSKAPIVGYNPRSHLLASGDNEFYLWQPDSDLIM